MPKKKKKKKLQKRAFGCFKEPPKKQCLFIIPCNFFSRKYFLILVIKLCLYNSNTAWTSTLISYLWKSWIFLLGFSKNILIFIRNFSIYLIKKKKNWHLLNINSPKNEKYSIKLINFLDILFNKNHFWNLIFIQ